MQDTNRPCSWTGERGLDSCILQFLSWLRWLGWMVGGCRSRPVATPNEDFSTFPPRSNTSRLLSNLGSIYWKYQSLVSKVLFKFHSGRKFLFFLRGVVGDFASDCSPDCSTFIGASGMPIIVGLGIVGNLVTVLPSLPNSPRFPKLFQLRLSP